MATIGKYQGATQSERVQRYFSEEFKQKKVRKIEQNLVTVVQISIQPMDF